MKKLLVLLASLLIVASICTGCKKNNITIAVPNDTTNEARALLLLEKLGYIKLKDGVDILATKLDIVENPYNIEIVEMDAAQIPNALKDVSYAIINSNYAIDANINPVNDSLAIEGSSSFYANIVAVKDGNQNSPLIKALVAALRSNDVVKYINEKYDGAVVSAVSAEDITDGYDTEIDYEALNGKTVTVGASPTPHAEILEVVKTILAKKGITLKIVEYTDYVIPNKAVESGDIDANYFQHVPYLDDFNANNGTHIVSVGGIHVEPMGLYGGKNKSLDDIKK